MVQATKDWVQRMQASSNNNKLQGTVVDHGGYDDVFDEESDFTLVKSKRKRTRQAARPGTVHRRI